MTPSEFWRSTPRETVMVIRAHRWREEQATRRTLETAWHTANQAAAAVYGKQKPLARWLKVPERLKSIKPKDVKSHLVALFSGFKRKKKDGES
jgi:hypothetical protein